MINAIALFCEDIRQDSIGAHILTGVLPDGIAFPEFPAFFPKIGIFVRVNVPIDFPPQVMTIRISGGSFPQPLENIISPEIVKLSQEQAVQQEAPFAGMITVIMASPLPVMKPDRLVVDLTIGDSTMVIGFLNLVAPETPAIQHEV